MAKVASPAANDFRRQLTLRQLVNQLVVNVFVPMIQLVRCDVSKTQEKSMTVEKRRQLTTQLTSYLTQRSIQKPSMKSDWVNNVLASYLGQSPTVRAKDKLSEKSSVKNSKQECRQPTHSSTRRMLASQLNWPGKLRWILQHQQKDKSEQTVLAECAESQPQDVKLADCDHKRLQIQFRTSPPLAVSKVAGISQLQDCFLVWQTFQQGLSCHVIKTNTF